MNRTSTLRSPLLPLPLPLPRRRGVAMLLVLGVVVMASVLGYAMLSSAAMTRQSSTNAAAAAGAQGIAESGLNLAMYYLQNPGAAPTYPTAYPQSEEFDRQGGFWEGTNGVFIDLGSPSIGQVKVTVTRPNPAIRWRYRIQAYGRAPGSTLERRVEATTYVNSEFRFDHATLTSNDAGLGSKMRVEGDAYSNGGLKLNSGAAVLGRGTRRRNVLSISPQLGWQNPPPVVPKVIPRFEEIRSYLKYEMPAGTARQATVLDTSVLGSSGILGIGAYGAQLGPTETNPAGIYYAPGDVTIHANSEILGTLIVAGNVSILGDNIHIRAASGFPALVVGGDVNFGVLSVAPTLLVEGVMYVAGRIDTGTLLFPTLDVEGSLLAGGTSPFFISLLDTSVLRVRHNRDFATVPDFSEVGRTPISVEVRQWQAQ